MPDIGWRQINELSSQNTGIEFLQAIAMIQE